jgi:hypothetical protein
MNKLKNSKFLSIHSSTLGENTLCYDSIIQITCDETHTHEYSLMVILMVSMTLCAQRKNEKLKYLNKKKDYKQINLVSGILFGLNY